MDGEADGPGGPEGGPGGDREKAPFGPLAATSSSLLLATYVASC